MSVNLYLTNLGTLSECPKWETGGYAGDKQFVALLPTLPSIVNYDAIQEAHFHRPLDIPAWREEIAKHEWPNPGRFELMCDLLEADPELWLYVSN